MYREHAPALYRYLVHLTGNVDTAEDVVQETFMRLLETNPRDGAVRGWLFRVATNVSRDDGRRRTRHARLLAAAPRDAATGDDPRDPGALLASAEHQRMVRAALATLPERDRIVLLMREEGFSHAEIAEAVGTTAKSVGTFIARALTRLAASLPPEVER